MAEHTPSAGAETKPARADPMAFSSILSSNSEPAKPATPVPKAAPVLKQIRRASKASNGDTCPPSVAATPVQSGRKQARKPSPVKDEQDIKNHGRETLKPKLSKAASAAAAAAKKAISAADKENESVLRIMAEIDDMEHSDLDAPGYEVAFEKYKVACRKRQEARARHNSD